MTRTQRIIRLGLALAVIGGLGACTVVPAQPGYYRAPPPAYGTAYPAYPAYGYPPAATVYYGSGYQYYDDRHDHRRHDRGYDNHRRSESSLPPPLQLHRDVRRSLGLPRLPGMP